MNLTTRPSEFQISSEELKPMKLLAWKKAYEATKEDGVITEKEEQELKSIQTYFNLSDEEIKLNKQELYRFRLLSEIQNGNLPDLSSQARLIPQKSEIVHWVEKAELLEEKTVSLGYVGGSHGVSIRIAKGLTYRVGASRGQMVKGTEVVSVSSGEFIITNKRLVFSGDKKNFTIKFPKLLNIDMFSNGMTLHTETGKPKRLMFFPKDSKDLEIMGAILSCVIGNE